MLGDQIGQNKAKTKLSTKLIQFEDDQDSQDSEKLIQQIGQNNGELQNVYTETIIQKQIQSNDEFIHLNPEKSRRVKNLNIQFNQPFKQENNRYEFEKIQQNQSQFFYRHQSSDQNKNYQSLRRNRSFKIKKQKYSENPQLLNSKILNESSGFTRNANFSKSVTKFKNIFQEAEDLLNSPEPQSKFAVHQQRIENKQRDHYSNIKGQNFKDKVKNNSIIKMSQNFNNNHQAQKKRVNFLIQEDTIKSNIFRSTANTDKPFRNRNYQDAVQRKLASSKGGRKNQGNKVEKRLQINIRQIVDLRAFLMKRIPKLCSFCAILRRDTSGFNTFWPEFKLEDKINGVYLLSAKKKGANTTSNYYISRNPSQITVQNKDYMGKVRSDFLGGCFNIFSPGVNPENFIKGGEKIRQLLATVIYQSQIANAAPKSMRVYILKSPYTYYDLQGINKKEQQTNLQDLYEIGKNSDKILKFKNRKPTYSKKEKKYTMNFGGRIKKASIKNFILEDTKHKDEVMVFGKLQGEDEFIMYISYPFTPYLGMAIALAELDSKIICE